MREKIRSMHERSRSQRANIRVRGVERRKESRKQWRKPPWVEERLLTWKEMSTSTQDCREMWPAPGECIHCKDRSKGVPPTHRKKPGIRLRSRLLQPLEDLWAGSITGVSTGCLSLSRPCFFLPANGVSMGKCVWRKSKVCASVFAVFLVVLFWLLSQVKGENILKIQIQ